MDELVCAADVDRNPCPLQLGEHVEHQAGGPKIDAPHPGQIDFERLSRRGPVAQPLRQSVACPGDIARQNQGRVVR